MTLTFIGLLQCAFGLLILLRGSLNAAFLFLIISLLFGGSASIILPALGNASIQPAQLSLAFVLLRVLGPKGGYSGALPEAVRANVVFALFTTYGIAAAIAAPRIFAGQIDVVPMRFDRLASLFETVPLAPSSQNITTSVYLVGTLATAMIAYIACRYRGGAETFVRGVIIVAWIHGLTGVLGSVFRGTGVDMVFDLFRNATYAQLDQSYQGFVRINGLFPEASSYAKVGLVWFIFMAECWYRGILTRQTGLTAIMLGLVLFFSTSSTAYLGLAGYFLLFTLRALIFPSAHSAAKLGQTGLVAIAAITAASLVLAAIPQLAYDVLEMLRHMTIDKSGSESGQQRLFWALQGWNAFLHSGGLGVGPGSFRSSSLFTAILGSMGIIGAVTFLVYLYQILQPMRASTWQPVDNLQQSLGGAAAFTALAQLIPSAVASPGPDPGTLFALFAGSALALRPPLRNSEGVPATYQEDAGPIEQGALSAGRFDKVQDKV